MQGRQLFPPGISPVICGSTLFADNIFANSMLISTKNEYEVVIFLKFNYIGIRLHISVTFFIKNTLHHMIYLPREHSSDNIINHYHWLVLRNHHIWHSYNHHSEDQDRLILAKIHKCYKTKTSKLSIMSFIVFEVADYKSLLRMNVPNPFCEDSTVTGDLCAIVIYLCRYCAYVTLIRYK